MSDFFKPKPILTINDRLREQLNKTIREALFYLTMDGEDENYVVPARVIERAMLIGIEFYAELQEAAPLEVFALQYQDTCVGLFKNNDKAFDALKKELRKKGSLESAAIVLQKGQASIVKVQVH